MINNPTKYLTAHGVKYGLCNQFADLGMGCHIQIKICAGYRDMLPRPISAETQVYLTNPAEAWVACPGILHRSYYVL